MEIRVKNCCFCINLRTGVLIVSYIGIIAVLLQFFDNLVQPKIPPVVSVILLLMALIPTSFLVYAVHRNRVDLMLVPLISYAITIVLFFLAPFVLPTILSKEDNTKLTPDKRNTLNLEESGSYFVGFWIVAVIEIYFWIVIYSLYKVMKEEEEANRNSTTGHDMPTIQTIS